MALEAWWRRVSSKELSAVQATLRSRFLKGHPSPDSLFRRAALPESFVRGLVFFYHWFKSSWASSQHA